MNKIKKYTTMFIIMVIILTTFSGCNNKNNNLNVNNEDPINKENNLGVNNENAINKENNYSQEIEMIRNISVDSEKYKNIGEVLDIALENYNWAEYSNYFSPTAKGSVEVTGIDKNTGKNIRIIWGIHMTDEENNNHFEKMEMEQDIFLGYSDFINYMMNYMN